MTENYPSRLNFEHPHLDRHTAFNDYAYQMVEWPFLERLRLRRDIYPSGMDGRDVSTLFLIAETRDPQIMQQLRPRTYLQKNGGGMFEVGTVDKWQRFQRTFVAPLNVEPQWMDEMQFGKLLGGKGFRFENGFYVHEDYPTRLLISSGIP